MKGVFEPSRSNLLTSQVENLRPGTARDSPKSPRESVATVVCGSSWFSAHVAVTVEITQDESGDVGITFCE